MLSISPFDERTIGYRPLCGLLDDCIIPDQRTFIINSYNFSLDDQPSIPKTEDDSNSPSSELMVARSHDLDTNHLEPSLQVEETQPKKVKELIQMYDHK